MTQGIQFTVVIVWHSSDFNTAGSFCHHISADNMETAIAGAILDTKWLLVNGDGHDSDLIEQDSFWAAFVAYGYQDNQYRDDSEPELMVEVAPHLIIPESEYIETMDYFRGRK